MSGSDENDLSAIAWPGFVDILSSVIIMFVFFVMIIAGALFFYMMIFKSQTANISMIKEQVIVREVEEENKDLKQKLEVLEEQVQTYEKKLLQEQADMSESKNQKVTSDASSIVIMFEGGAITVSDDAQAELQTFITSYLKDKSPAKVSMKVVAGKDVNAPTESAARRLAVARLFNARNALMENKTLLKEKIEIEVRGEEQIEESYNWIRIELSGGEQ